MERLDVGDARIAYTDEGQGDPVLLLHGSFSADWFTPVGRRLAARHRVLKVHRAGYGRSEDLAGGASVAAHARHAVRVLEAAGVRRAHLVGHSSGAAVALQLALRRPDMAGTLVLLDAAFPYAPDEPGNPAMPRAVEVAAEGDYERAFDVFLGGVSGPGFREVFVRELGEEGLRQAVAGSRYFFTTEGPALRSWDFGPEQAAAVTAPVLLAVGGEGERLGTAYRARGAQLASWLPDSETRVLRGVSHASPLEDPASVAAAVEEFAARRRR
ncbi:alpha/beta fold hydrolase [Streptomyces sp. NPDC049040]|uniref:alpha/beta fold hydrolase n=1 Tax=Streptomyces sp. NPDC049040 TaxID=3365593 RepID=UPI00371967ED